MNKRYVDSRVVAIVTMIVIGRCLPVKGGASISYRYADDE